MEVNKKWRILLVDDHRILLEGIKTLFHNEPDLEVVAEASSANMARQMLERLSVDLLLTDLSMPDTVHTDFIKEVRQRYPSLNILVLSMHDESQLIQDVLAAGAQGYVLKSNSKDELVHAIRQVLSGQTYVSPDVQRKLLEAGPATKGSLLTQREIEIVRLMAQEYANKQIADKLFISERTVESHRKNIFKKLNTHSAVGVIRYAMNNNLL
jgi:DNA-binding NarL/FixJ family response regulator